MEYLKHVLGIHVINDDCEIESVPNFIDTRYRLKRVSLDGRKAVFVYPKTEPDAVNLLKKHLERIENAVGVPAVLVLNHLTYRQKEYLCATVFRLLLTGSRYICLLWRHIYRNAQTRKK